MNQRGLSLLGPRGVEQGLCGLKKDEKSTCSGPGWAGDQVCCGWRGGVLTVRLLLPDLGGWVFSMISLLLVARSPGAMSAWLLGPQHEAGLFGVVKELLLPVHALSVAPHLLPIPPGSQGPLSLIVCSPAGQGGVTSTR